MSDSIVVRLKPGLSRDDADNSGTICFTWPAPPRPDFREAFLGNYETIRSQLSGLSGAGVVVAAIGPSGFEGSAAVSARSETINVLTVGRHSRSSLFLSGDPSMSLRQGAVIVYPLVPGEAVRFRILDLRATLPFEDESGVRFEALEANGPVFLRSGRCLFFVFPREPGALPWPASAEAAWEAMPERTCLEEVGLDRAGRRPEELLTPRSDRAQTLVLSLPGPFLEREKLLHEGESPRGQLVVRSNHGEMTLVLGAAAVARGVLLGRYERCDGSQRPVLSSASISRVHALVIELAGKLYVVDAGSTNGVWRGGERVPLTRLITGQLVTLAGSVATLEWSFSH
jgi:FHA domain